MLDAIVLAGSPNAGPLRECSTAPKEALIEIGGRYMVDYVLGALDTTEEVNKIILVGVGPQDIKYTGSKDISWVPAGDTLLESLEHGLSAVSAGNKVLLVTADIPLLNSRAIKVFLGECGDWEADLYYPIVSREVSERRFPGVKRTYATFRDGTYTGGNLFLLEPEAILRCREMLKAGVELRKSPWRLCRLLGMRFLCKFLCRQLSLQEAESKIQNLLGLRARVVITQCPEIGIDVDKPSDLRIVEQELSRLPS
ncbi:MAG: NTP transferase domain-containing protein [Clostridia bacterium]|nr:NTP transferase domain-containing protein [Clostridia bacterium]